MTPPRIRKRQGKPKRKPKWKILGVDWGTKGGDYTAKVYGRFNKRTGEFHVTAIRRTEEK